MTDRSSADVDLIDDEFERLGKRAGAELRRQPPPDGPGAVQRSAQRRRATVGAVAAGVTIAIVVAGLVVTNSWQDEPAPTATLPPTPVAPTTTLVLEDATPADALRTTTPGTWRAVADPSPLAPEFPAAAVWTGTDVIVIGSNWADSSELSSPSAVAYDVGRDRWRGLADPPPALGQASADAASPAMKWTGSEVLAVTRQGAVYSYDPIQDRWESRAAADETMSLPAADALVAVSPHGVLARSSTGWWWYDNTTDRWEPVPAPSSGVEYSVLTTLDQDRIVATRIEGATITSAVFDIASRSWSKANSEAVPVSNRAGSPTTCDANDGVLVCWAEGFNSLDGVVIDPLLGRLHTFELGSHSNPFTVFGLPWMTHASKLLSPRTATWEDLPPSPASDADGFMVAAWTGSEIVFVRGDSRPTQEANGLAAAYTPIELPGR